MNTNIENNKSNHCTLPERYNDLHGKKLLVTGAAGFIGGALFQRLTDCGLDVTGTVLYPEEAKQLRARGFKAEVLDLLSDEPWDELLKGVDIVFHIAAMFQEVEYGREVYNKANNDGALKLLKTAKSVGVKRFVHCSTVGVLGDVKEIPATEDTPFNPMDEYHETKLAGELSILKYAATLPEDGMVVTVNRPAMVYGPGDMRMLKLFKAIISGKFFMIGSGDTLGHLGYIEDQVDSFLLSAVAPRDKVHLEAFNIASDKPLTLNEMAEMIARAGGVKNKNIHIPLAPVWFAAWLCEMIFKPFKIKPPLFRRRVGFFTHNRAFDLSKAKKLMGYEFQWDNEKGIAETIKWYRSKRLI